MPSLSRLAPLALATLAGCRLVTSPPPATTGSSGPQVQPFLEDPGGTGAVAAEFIRDSGLAAGGAIPQNAIVLRLGAGAKPGARAGVRLAPLPDGPMPRVFGFDFRSGGDCDAKGPLIEFEGSNGAIEAVPCGAGRIEPTPGVDGWTRVTVAAPAFQDGITLADIRVVAVFTGMPSRVVIGGFVGFKVEVGWPGLHIYVADPHNNRILRIDNMLTSGATANVTAFGQEGTGAGQFRWPADVTVDVQNRIYIADRLNNRIVRINNMTGAGWQEARGAGTCLDFSAADQMCQPVGVFVDGLGRIYVREYDVRTLRLDNISGSGLTELAASQQQNWTPYQDVYLDGAWRIHSSSPWERRIDRVDDMSGAGKLSLVCGPTSGWTDPLCTPFGLAIDPGGRIYIADWCSIVRVNDLSGAGFVRFQPAGLCFGAGGVTSVGLDSYGRIYFAARTAGGGTVWRINDMSGTGLVNVGPLSAHILGGIWVEDQGP